MPNVIPNAQVRQYLYGIVTVALPLLAAFHVVPVESVPELLALAAAVLATGTATVAVTAQRRKGTL